MHVDARTTVAANATDRQLHVPAYDRRRAAVADATEPQQAQGKAVDNLDVPTFLRRKLG
jgi:hypothetical protein